MGIRRAGAAAASLILWIVVGVSRAQDVIPGGAEGVTGVSQSRQDLQPQEDHSVTGTSASLQAHGAGARKITLDQALDLTRRSGQQLSAREIDELSERFPSHSAAAIDGKQGSTRRSHGSRTSADGRIDRIAREEFYGCLEAQMRMEVFEHAGQDAKVFVVRAQQLEGSQLAPHSDVLKAELTEKQREDEVMRSSHEWKVCQGNLAVLFHDAETSYELVSPVPSALPDRGTFMRAVADAHPSLSRYLTTQSTGAVAEAPFSERLLLSEIAAAYEEAVFDAGEVERLKSIRDDARQSQILIQFRYRGGEASIYDVTSGQDAAIAADLAFVSGSVRAMRSRDEVDRLGRGD